MGYYLIDQPQKHFCQNCVIALMTEAGMRFSRWLDLIGDEELDFAADLDAQTVTVRLNAAWQTYSFASLGVSGCCLQQPAA